MSAQRVYAYHASGPSNSSQFSVIMVKGERSVFWFAQVLFLFHFNTRTKDRMLREVAFVRYFQITFSIDNVYHVLIGLCLKWETDDDANHSVSQSVSGPGVIEAGE